MKFSLITLYSLLPSAFAPCEALSIPDPRDAAALPVAAGTASTDNHAKRTPSREEDRSRLRQPDMVQIRAAGNDDNDDDFDREALGGGGVVTYTDTAMSLSVRAVSYNVRYATDNPVKNEEYWQIRGPKLSGQLRFIVSGQESAFLCLQEALSPQVDDIQFTLGAEWAHIGQGRDDGDRKGEFSPIFFKPRVWKLEKSKTMWLSKTPNKPSKGWDATLPRVVTVGQFVHRESNTKAVVMSTHLDHKGSWARKESAKLLLKIADDWAKDSGAALVVMGGDFNSDPSDGAYKAMVAKDSGMVDASHAVAESNRYGNELTYTSFGENPAWKPSRIDFLFVKDTGPIEVSSFGVLPNKFDDDMLLSDHRPVVADFTIPSSIIRSRDPAQNAELR